MMNEIVIRIEGLEELTKAVQMLAASHSGQEMQAPAAALQPIQAPTAAPQPIQAQIPVVQSVPVQAPVPSAVPATQAPAFAPVQVPTTALPQQYSFDQLAVAMSNLCANANEQPKVHALLNQFGVSALFDLPKERYGEFATALRGIGGVI